jgi:PAS domain S-box-containing protein
MARALVIDDERTICRAFSMVLQHGGHRVDVAGNLAEAREQLEHQRYDVVISDVMMPDGSGADLLEETARRRPDTKFILVTGQPTPGIAARAAAAGAFAFLRKPVSASALLELVNAALANRGLEEENRRLVDEARNLREHLGRLSELQAAEGSGGVEAILQGDARVKSIASKFPGCIVRMRSDPDGRFRFTFIGEGGDELLGVDPEEVLFDPAQFTALIHPDDRDEFEATRREAGRSLSEWVWEGRVHPVDGDERWLRFAFNPTRTPDGIIDWDGVVLDVSENRRLQAELMLSDRMASVGSLAAGLAHEVNNPLTVVLANLEIAAALIASQPSSVTGEIAGLLTDTLSEVERIRAVISSLRHFAPHEADVRRVDLQALLDDVLRLAAPELRHRARVVRNYANEAHVMGSPGHLSQLFLNLVLNAAQAIVEGNAEQNEVRVSIGRHIDGGAIVSISDTGKGMGVELQRRVFDPFVTTWETSDGSGLGLFICQRIVSALGGKISVSSRLGRGTTIEVVLPHRAGMEPERIPTPPPKLAIVPRGRVLVIDDDAGIRRTLQRVLAEHDVEVAASGREGLALLREDAEFDVVFCDLLMPEMTGMDLFEAIKDSHPELARRFVFMTGGAFTPRAAEFLDGAEGRSVSKPFEIAEIRAVLDDILVARDRG